MLKNEQLSLYLAQYHALALHHNPQLKQMTLDIIEWQKQRMQDVHINLFTPNAYLAVREFFFSHFYSFKSLELLAQQLEKALNEKIKLDRWLPNEILETIVNGFHLALITLESDSKLAELLLNNNLTVTSDNLLQVIPQAKQTELRYEQLELLNKVSQKILKFSNSFLLRSTLRLAKPKIEQRGFSTLNQYIEDGLKAMRSHKKSQTFFHQLIHQEKLFLNYLTIQQPQHLNVYYDAKYDRLMTLSTTK